MAIWGSRLQKLSSAKQSLRYVKTVAITDSRNHYLGCFCLTKKLRSSLAMICRSQSLVLLWGMASRGNLSNAMFNLYRRSGTTNLVYESPV